MSYETGAEPHDVRMPRGLLELPGNLRTGGRPCEHDAALLQGSDEVVEQVEVDLAGQEVPGEPLHRARKLSQLRQRAFAVGGGREMGEVADVAHEVRPRVIAEMTVVERSGRREDEPREQPCAAIGLGDERSVPCLGLLRVVVDAVVDAEHVADGSDRPRPSRVVEPGHARMRQASCRAPDHPCADAAVDGAADPIPLSPWQHVERLAHGDPRRDLLARDQASQQRQPAGSPDQPQQMRSEEVAGLDEENGMPALGRAPHDLLAIRRQGHRPFLR